MGESSNSGQYQKLPPGWDCKYDQATGNCYYINYFTKAMQLEDPRIRYKQLQNERCSTESIPLQPLHGSPYHVYPSNNLPAMRAFHAGPNTTHNAHPSWQHMSSSPLLSSRGNLEMSPLPFPKLAVTQTPRLGNMSRRSTIQETSFSNHIDTDAVVTKIQNMFPTASENHIRLLLRRYYNREAVVISALQVEKHPVTMPGPFVTPPSQRHLFHSNSAFQMTPPSRRLDIGHQHSSAFGGGGGSGTSRTASPLPGGRFGSVISMNSSGRGIVLDGGTAVGSFIGTTTTGTAGTTTGTAGFGFNHGHMHGHVGFGSGYGAMPSSILLHGSPRFGEQWRSSPKPHSSPKMKLRYMKTIFPKADEMLLLDILASADNNVQKASQTLISMGYTKREYTTPKPGLRPGLGAEAAEDNAELQKLKHADEQIIPLRPKEYTQEEKEAMQQRLKEKYKQIAERIIIMALESVKYSEDRAIQILQIVQNEEDATKIAKDAAALSIGGLLPANLESIGEMDLQNGILKGSVSNATDAITADNIITVVVEETQLPNGNSSFTKQTNNDKCMQMMDEKNLNQNQALIKPSSSPSSTSITTPITTTTAIKTQSKNSSTTTLIKKNLSSTFSTSVSASSTSSIMKMNPQTMMKKRAFPSINLTTPTTATTQIILSNSPIYAENENNENALKTDEIGLITHDEIDNEKSKNSKSITSTSSPSKSKSPSSASPSKSLSFEAITIKSMLARFKSSTISTLTTTTTTNNKQGKLLSSSNEKAYGTATLLEKLKLSSRPPRDKFDTLKHSQRGSYEDETDASQQQQEFKSIIGRIPTMGPNNELRKGPDESLLLADYVTWNGANPDISTGQRNISAAGSDPSLLSERTYVAQGRNTELCKGAKRSLAKGSIYAQLRAPGNSIGSSKSANIKCN